MYYEFNVGNNVYKLRLSTKNIINLEKKLGVNPLMIFGLEGDRIPTITEMIDILFYSMNQLQHGINYDSAMEIFDAWLEEGHTTTDFIAVILEVYKTSGIISKDDEPKNA